MINTSINICGKLPEGLIELYAAVAAAVGIRGIKYLVIGAMARDLDLVPFGPIADESSKIAWPPSNDVVMSVLGFDEALDSSITVTIREALELQIPVASPTGMALLKLVAWTERQADQKQKDALDLYYLLSTYACIGQIEEEAYDSGVIARFDHDLDLAGANLLGQHARDIAKDKTVEHILEIPCGNIAARNLDSLLTAIAYRDRDSARVEEMVAAFFAGFENPG